MQEQPPTCEFHCEDMRGEASNCSLPATWNHRIHIGKIESTGAHVFLYPNYCDAHTALLHEAGLSHTYGPWQPGWQPPDGPDGVLEDLAGGPTEDPTGRPVN